MCELHLLFAALHSANDNTSLGPDTCSVWIVSPQRIYQHGYWINCEQNALESITTKFCFRQKNTDILSFEVFILATGNLAICCNTIWFSNYNFITYLPTQFSILMVTYDLTDPHSGVIYLNWQQIFIWFSISIVIWRIT